MAYIYDPYELSKAQINSETLLISDSLTDHWLEKLKVLIEEHNKETGSNIARDILDNWSTEKEYFLQICPKEMVTQIRFPIFLNETQPKVGT